MSEPLPTLIENAIQIAWNYLERTGQIKNPEFTSQFLLESIEHMVRMGERRRSGYRTQRLPPMRNAS